MLKFNFKSADVFRLLDKLRDVGVEGKPKIDHLTHYPFGNVVYLNLNSSIGNITLKVEFNSVSKKDIDVDIYYYAENNRLLYCFKGKYTLLNNLLSKDKLPKDIEVLTYIEKDLGISNFDIPNQVKLLLNKCLTSLMTISHIQEFDSEFLILDEHKINDLDNVYDIVLNI